MSAADDVERPLRSLVVDEIQAARRQCPGVYAALIRYDALYLGTLAKLDVKEVELQKCIEVGQEVLNQLQDVKKRYRVLSEESSSHSRSEERYAQSISRVRAEAESAEGAMEGLKVELAESHEKYSRLQLDATKLRKENQVLQARLSEASENLSFAEQTILQMNSEVVETNTAAVRLREAEMESLRKRLKIAHEDCDRLASAAVNIQKDHHEELESMRLRCQSLERSQNHSANAERAHVERIIDFVKKSFPSSSDVALTEKDFSLVVSSTIERLEDLRQKVEKYEERVQRLETERSAITMECDQMRKRMINYREEASDVERAIEIAASDDLASMKTLREEKACLEALIASMKKDYAAKVNDLESHINDLEAKVTTDNEIERNQFTFINDALSSLTSTDSKFTPVVARFLEALSKGSPRKVNAKSFVDRFMDDIDAEVIKDIQLSRDMLKLRDEQHTRSVETIREQQNDLLQLRRRIETLETERDHIAISYQRQQMEAQHLKEEHERTYERTMYAGQSEADLYKKRCLDLEKKIDGIAAEHSQEIMRVRSVSRERSGHEADLIAENKRLLGEVSQLRERVQLLETAARTSAMSVDSKYLEKIDLLTKLLHEARAELETTTSEIEDLRLKHESNIASKDNQKSELHGVLRQAHDRITELQDDIRRLQGERDDMKRKITRQKSAILVGESEEGEIVSLPSVYTLKHKIDLQQRVLEDTTHQLERERNRSLSAVDELQQLKSKIMRLQDDQAVLTAENSALQASNAALQARVTAVEADRDPLRERLHEAILTESRSQSVQRSRQTRSTTGDC